MAVKIVTDSVSDITSDLAEKLGVTVVPVYVHFGTETYRDRVEISTEEFYRRLATEPVFPRTTQPPPQDFLVVYEKLAKETDELLVIVLSKKVSGTYESALQAKAMIKAKCRIEVIDSQSAAMGLGLIVIAAAKAAQSGARLDELMELVQKKIPVSHPVMFVDTLKYLAKGGRIGKAQGLLGSLLAVKPVITMRDGEVFPMTRLRSRTAGLDYLYNFVAGSRKIEELAVEHATTPEEADKLVDRLSTIYPKEKIYRSNVSPVLGTYVGPHVLSVSVLEGD